MTASPERRPITLAIARNGLVAGLACAAVLVIAVAVRYPLDLGRTPIYTVGTIGALLILVALAAWLAGRGLRPRDPGAMPDIRRGLTWGVVFGALWMLEIGYNNVIAPPVSVRDPVDDLIWAIIALGMLILATLIAARARRLAAGLRASIWSGLMSGLVACLTALALAVFGIPLLLADPANIAEYAVRGPTSGFPTMAAYLAYQTLAGAMLHLVVLGLGMGAALGALGGLAGSMAIRVGIGRLRVPAAAPSELQRRA
jgi:hypothetical protein